MDNVLAQVMVSAGDPHLVAGQAIAAAQGVLPVRHGACRDIGQDRSRLRLGQAHGAEPAPLDQRQRELPDLRRAAERRQEPRIGGGEHRIGGGGDVRRQELREGRAGEQAWQSEPAQLGRETRREQPQLGIFPQCCTDLRQSMHAGFVLIGLNPIGGLVVGQKRIRGQPHG